MVDAHDGLSAFIEDLTTISDPRCARGKRHLLEDILCIALMAMLCGNDDAEAIAEWGEFHEEWLREFLELPHGIPSQDTFLRVFAMLDPKSLEMMLLRWARQRVPSWEALSLHIDGKTLRGTPDGETHLHVVSVYTRQLGLVLGQWRAENGRRGEISSIRDVLAVLSLKGTTVTIDALGCQRDVAQTIVSKGGDYILAAKGNQPALHADIIRAFADADEDAPRAFDRRAARPLRSWTSTDAGHGRIETRQVDVIDEIDDLFTGDRWAGLSSLLRVRSSVLVEKTEATREQTRYYITSIKQPDPERMLDEVRGHWSIENQLHWCLDVSLREDAHRVRDRRAAACFAAMRRYTLNLLRLAPKRKKRQSLAITRKRCSWDPVYLATVLQGARQLDSPP